jgi:hypothetical protein
MEHFSSQDHAFLKKAGWRGTTFNFFKKFEEVLTPETACDIISKQVLPHMKPKNQTNAVFCRMLSLALRAMDVPHQMVRFHKDDKMFITVSLNGILFNKDQVAANELIMEGKKEIMTAFNPLIAQSEAEIAELKIPDIGEDLHLRGSLRVDSLPNDKAIKALRDRSYKAHNYRAAAALDRRLEDIGKKVGKTQETQKDMVERKLAANKLAEELKEGGFKAKYNEWKGALTVFYVTTKDKAAAILKDSAFPPKSLFSLSRATLAQAGKKEQEEIKVLTVDTDPRDIIWDKDAKKFQAPEGLARDQEGCWVSPKRLEKEDSLSL